MDYKNTLYFVAKALLISKSDEAFTIVSKAIESNKVDWEKVIQLSTKHYVLPALFCNFTRKKLLPKLPSDLVSFMAVSYTHLTLPTTSRV